MKRGFGGGSNMRCCVDAETRETPLSERPVLRVSDEKRLCVCLCMCSVCESVLCVSVCMCVPLDLGSLRRKKIKINIKIVKIQHIVQKNIIIDHFMMILLWVL